jgi:hypothetical protein
VESLRAMRSNNCSGMAAFRRMLMLAFATVLVFGVNSILFAAEQEKPQSAPKSDTGVKNPGKKDAKSTVPQEKIKGEELEISVKAPQAYYIMPRSNLNIEGLELNESFIPKIIKSVEEEPF